MEILLSLILIILSLVMQAFFAGSEMGIISSNRIKVSYMSLQGDKRAGYLEKLLRNPEKLLGTTLVGVNIAVITGSSIAASVTSKFFKSAEMSAVVSTLIMWPFVLIFGQILPMSFARKHSTAFSLAASIPIRTAYFVLFPFVFLASNLANFFSKLFGGGRAKKSHFVTRDELKLLIKEGMKKGVIGDDIVMDMAYEIFDFGETDAEDVMVPLKNVVSASKDVTVDGLIRIIVDTGYSLIPVYSEKPDNIIGVAKATDLLIERPDKKALDVIRPCYLVRENTLLEDVLKKMQQDKVNFALVTDRAGKLIGIITLEDIIEEIVGEIEDEYKKSTLQKGLLY